MLNSPTGSNPDQMGFDGEEVDLNELNQLNMELYTG